MGFVGSAIGGINDTISSGIGSIFGSDAENWSRKLHDPAGILGGNTGKSPERPGYEKINPYEKYNPYIIGGNNTTTNSDNGLNNKNGFGNKAGNFTPPSGMASLTTPAQSRFIDSSKITDQITKNAAVQKGQNVAGYNGAVGSNRALNPALASYLMGNKNDPATLAIPPIKPPVNEF